MSVTHTLTGGPRVLLYSRTADTLSLRAARNVLTLLRHVGHRLNVAVIFVARRLSITGRVFSQITIVRGNIMIRRNGAFSIFDAPGRPAAGTLIRYCLNVTIPPRLIPSLPTNAIIRLQCGKSTTLRPLVDQITRSCNIDVSILRTGIRCFNSRTVNVLVILISNTKRPLIRTLGALEARIFDCQRLSHKRLIITTRTTSGRRT